MKSLRKTFSQIINRWTETFLNSIDPYQHRTGSEPDPIMMIDFNSSESILGVDIGTVQNLLPVF